MMLGTGCRQGVRGEARTRVRLSFVLLLVLFLQPLAALPAAARDKPQLPEAKGLGPRPGHSFSGDCRDPMSDPRQLCIQSARTGSLSISPHVVQACKKTLFQTCPKITATFTPKPGAVRWDMQFGKCAPFTLTPAPDSPAGQSGGPTSCTLEATAPTNGWSATSVGITGPCGSLKAVRDGKAEFAACAGTTSSDYYAIIPAGVGIIDGTITEKDGKTPITGLAVQIRGADNRRSVAYTDSTGYYSAYVDEGDYTICPCKFKDEALNNGAPDVFTPRSPNIHVSGYRTQDFVEGGWTISGKMSRKVERKGDPVLSGVTVAIIGKSGFYREATTDRSGAYSMTVPEGSYVVEGETPPMVRPGEFIDGPSWQCRDGGVESHTAACVFQLTQDKPTVDFVMNNQYELKLTEEKKPALPGRKVQKITARVTDSRGYPVAGKKVHFSASAPGGKIVLGTPDGGQLYSSVPGPDGKPFTGDFELNTDWDGVAELYKWADALGKLALKAALDNSTDKDSKDLSTYPNEVASLDDNPVIPSVGPPLPGDIGDILEKAVHGRLGARPAPLSTNASLQFNIMNSLNGLADTGNADFEPVRTADDKGGGVIVYPRYTDDKAIAAIAAFLATPTSGEQTSPAVSGAFVIDMDDVGKLIRDPNSNRIIPSRLTPLSTWATAHPRSIEGMIDRTDETGIRAGTLHRGFPKPPAVQKRKTADRALGAQFAGTIIRTRGKVRVLATVRSTPAPTGKPAAAAPAVPPSPLAGKKAGLDASRQIVMEIPAAEVLHYARIASSVKLLSYTQGVPEAADNTSGDSEEVVYYLPIGLDYDIETTGTGSGKASVTVQYGYSGGSSRGFNLDAGDGRSGTFSISSEGEVPTKFTFGGKPVAGGNGPALKLSGIPKAVTTGSSQTVNLKVVDQFGDPVAGARVDIGSTSFTEHDWTDAEGTLTMHLKVRNTDALSALARADGYTNATANIRVNAAPRTGSDEALAMVARTPDPPLAGARALFDPWLLAIAAGLVAVLVAGVVVVRRRRRFLEIVNG